MNLAYGDLVVYRFGEWRGIIAMVLNPKTGQAIRLTGRRWPVGGSRLVNDLNLAVFEKVTPEDIRWARDHEDD